MPRSAPPSAASPIEWYLLIEALQQRRQPAHVVEELPGPSCFPLPLCALHQLVPFKCAIFVRISFRHRFAIGQAVVPASMSVRQRQRSPTCWAAHLTYRLTNVTPMFGCASLSKRAENSKLHYTANIQLLSLIKRPCDLTVDISLLLAAGLLLAFYAVNS